MKTPLQEFTDRGSPASYKRKLVTA
jgi:hypothetical protein